MADSVGRKLTLAALVLSTSVLLSRLLGFVRDALIAYLLGAGTETDAYYAAFTLPDLMNYFLAGGTLSITFIPLYTRFIAKGRDEAGDRLVSVVLTNMGLLLTAMLVLGEVFAPELVAMLFPGFGATELARTTELTRIVMPAQLFFYVGGVLSAVLMARERFVAVAAVPLVYNFSIIAFGLVLHSSMGVAGFSVGAVVGAFLGPFLIPLLAVRKGIRFRPRLNFRDRDFVRYVKLTLPLMLGVSLLTADEWIGRFFGSSMESGTITWLNNARRLMLVPMALIGQAAGQAALPFLSRLVAEQREKDMRQVLSATLRAAVYLSILCAAFAAVFSDAIIAVVYQRGAYLVSDSVRTANILLCFCPAIVGWTAQVVAVRGFYANSDTVRPMIIGTVVTGLCLPLYAAFGERWDAEGLALATSAGIVLNAAATLLLLSKRYQAIEWAGFASGSVKGAVLALVLTPCLLVVRESFQGPWVTLFVGFAVFASVVLIGSYLFGGYERKTIERVVRRFARRKKSL